MNRKWKKYQPLQEKDFEALFEKHYQMLFSVGFRMCANRDMTKDVLQSFFLELWEKRSKLKEVDNWGGYLRTAFYRRMLAELKKNRLPTQQLSEAEQKISTPSYETLLINFQQNETRQKEVKDALNQLPEQQKEMLKLRFHEGWSYEEIAANTGKSKQTVYNQIYEAIKKLKKSMIRFVLM